jgi:hypothetical protein
MRITIRLVIAIQLTLAVLSCGGGTGTEDVAEKYLEAWKKHDIETLSEMIAPDVVLDLGRGTLVGRKHIIAPVEFSAGANTRLEFNELVVRGDTVEFEMVEKNEIVTACGFEEIRHYPRLIFENGLLRRQETVKEIPNFRRYAEQWSILRSWIRRNRPDIIDKVTTPNGGYRISREAGELMALMAKTWQESKLVE